MKRSTDRVKAAADRAGLEIEIRRMGESTRTAKEAAEQCGCEVAQIVKSLVFQGADSAALFLFLVSGDKSLDLAKAAALTGEKLERADPRHVREETGFAIGGVAPIGHKIAVPCFADQSLLRFDVVWAAAGAHDAVFSARPDDLFRAANATAADIAA
ncbi:MAG: YbaK/EbsC family protein [Notoacmeibacter sp.]|nr:YbaK/EbsC family protein [Notoacmeibacter sp.]